MRHAAGMARRAAAGKTRHSEIETAPEKLQRAGLAEEAGAELLEHPIGIEKNLKKAPERVRVVGGVRVILREADRLRQFVRHLVDHDVNAELGENSHNSRVKTSNRFSGQGKLPRCAFTGRNPRMMIDEVEVDLEGP